MEAKATAKFIRVSPMKMRRVVDLIRGQHIDEARRVLQFSTLGATTMVAKVLNSAVANAEHKELIAQNLFVKAVWVDEGPTMKRFRPRAQGRAFRIRKRTSHITVVVSEDATPAGKKG